MEEPPPQAGRGGEHGAVYGEGSRGAWAGPLPYGPTAHKINEKAFQDSLPFSPNLFLAVRMMKHKGVKSKETTEISTQRHISNLTGRPAVNTLAARK